MVDIVPTPRQHVQGQHVQLSIGTVCENIIADAGYPDIPWVVTPFPSRTLLANWDLYNYK